MSSNNKKKCPKCSYEWTPRRENHDPKSCPRCKTRLDYQREKVDQG